MEKIKVIFTGGTIGSLATGNDINPNENARFLLLQKYGKNLERFDIEAPLNILSENANLNDILLMAKAIKKAQIQNYKGIILTHGTDTLAYSSAYLSLLVKCKIPVVMVSANYILTNPKSNGLANFATAVELIDNPLTKPNIYVSYKNVEDNFTSIHLGSRMLEPSAYSDSFHSPNGFRYGYSKNGIINFENTTVTKIDKKFPLQGDFTKKGLYINPYNGLDYSIYDNIKCDFVLHNLYHSGTANTCDYHNNNYQTNFLKFADNCNLKNIPLYLCNIDKKDVNYNSTNQMLQKNIKFMYNVLPNVALAKLNIAYSLIDKENRAEYLDSNISGEKLYSNEQVKTQGEENTKQ